MKIEAQFESYEEMVAFANKLASDVKPEVQSKSQKTKEEKKVLPSESETSMTTAPQGIEVNNQIADEMPIDDATKTVVEEETPKVEGETVYTPEQIRAKLTELSRTGKAKEVKQLLTSLGASNVSSLDPSKYAEAMEKAGNI